MVLNIGVKNIQAGGYNGARSNNPTFIGVCTKSYSTCLEKTRSWLINKKPHGTSRKLKKPPNTKLSVFSLDATNPSISVLRSSARPPSERRA